MKKLSKEDLESFQKAIMQDYGLNLEGDELYQAAFNLLKFVEAMFTIQKANINEVPEIKKLLKSTWIDTYGSYYSPESIEEITSSWHDPKLLAAQIQNPEYYFATAKSEEGNLVGIITARRIENEQTLQLDRLYILPKYQGKGIGKQLLNKALTAFDGITTVFLEVEAMNKNAIDFYLKQGFEQYDESEETIGNKKFKVIEMVMKLS